MKTMLLAVLATASLFLAGCADPPNDSVKFGQDTVAKSALTQMKANRDLKRQDACKAEVDKLPKDQLAKYNKDDVLKGCLRGTTSDG